MVYELEVKPDSVYFYLIKKALKNQFPACKITKIFQIAYDSEWYVYLSGARNRMEHGQVPFYQFRRDEKRIYIADDQKVDPHSETYNKNYNPIEWCSTISNESLRFVEACCLEMDKVLYK